MKNSTKIALLFLTGIEILGALLLFNLMSGSSFIVKLGVLVAIVLISLAMDAAVLHGNSASVVSDAKKLKAVI